MPLSAAIPSTIQTVSPSSVLRTSQFFDGPVPRIDLRGRKGDFVWHLRTLPLSTRFTASQPTVSVAIVDRYVADRWYRHIPMRDLHPLLIETDGRLVIYDGHHRIAAAIQRGDSHLACWVGVTT